MTTLPVVTYPDPRLRLPTETVWEFDEALILMIMDMLDTMHNDRGVGLAAPQVGVLKKGSQKTLLPSLCDNFDRRFSHTRGEGLRLRF